MKLLSSVRSVYLSISVRPLVMVTSYDDSLLQVLFFVPSGIPHKGDAFVCRSPLYACNLHLGSISASSDACCSVRLFLVCSGMPLLAQIYNHVYMTEYGIPIILTALWCFCKTLFSLIQKLHPSLYLMLLSDL